VRRSARPSARLERYEPAEQNGRDRRANATAADENPNLSLASLNSLANFHRIVRVRPLLLRLPSLHCIEDVGCDLLLLRRLRLLLIQPAEEGALPRPGTGPYAVATQEDGQLTLKRGMTAGFDLWKWFAKVGSDGWRGVRATAEVVVLSSDGKRVDARFVLSGCLPVKLKAPALNALSGQVAIEEMQLVYETMKLREADDAAPGGVPTT